MRCSATSAPPPQQRRHPHQPARQQRAVRRFRNGGDADSIVIRRRVPQLTGRHHQLGRIGTRRQRMVGPRRGHRIDHVASGIGGHAGRQRGGRRGDGGATRVGERQLANEGGKAHDAIRRRADGAAVVGGDVIVAGRRVEREAGRRRDPARKVERGSCDRRVAEVTAVLGARRRGPRASAEREKNRQCFHDRLQRGEEAVAGARHSGLASRKRGRVARRRQFGHAGQATQATAAWALDMLSLATARPLWSATLPTAQWKVSTLFLANMRRLWPSTS